MSQRVNLPQPEDISNSEKEDAMGAYLMMFAAWAVGLPLPILNLVAAFIYFMINRKKSRFVAFHGLQSMLSQIPVTILNIGVIVWLIRNLVVEDLANWPQFLTYLAFVGLVNLLYVIFSLVAMVKAKKGNFYYMPFFGRIAFARYYGPDAPPLERPTPPNRPPEGF
jgi:uncharacterized membrane protein